MTRTVPLPALAPVRRFMRDERGSATIEFTIFVPSFLFLFLSSFESGMLMLRQVMLDRAVDQTIREVRIGAFNHLAGDPQRMYEAIRADMCDRRGNVGDCRDDLKIEMQQADPRDWGASIATLAERAQCVDRLDDDTRALTNFRPGVENQLMVLRVCELFDPFFPTVGLGAVLAQGDGYYALSAMTAYVLEPTR